MEIIVHQAILHVLDTTLDAPVLSGSCMEMTAEKTAYLQYHIEKLLGCICTGRYQHCNRDICNLDACRKIGRIFTCKSDFRFSYQLSVCTWTCNAGCHHGWKWCGCKAWNLI